MEPVRVIAHGSQKPREDTALLDAQIKTVRESLLPHPPEAYRRLTRTEIELLTQNGNRCDNWDQVLVCDPFGPMRITNCRFEGTVRIGRMNADALEQNGLRLPVGISNSRIVSCDIGDDVAIHDVHYLAGYSLGASNLLFNIGALYTTGNGTFGSGVHSPDSQSSKRLRIAVINEKGGREPCPFEGMLPADAALWALFGTDPATNHTLEALTDATMHPGAALFATTGAACVLCGIGECIDAVLRPGTVLRGARTVRNATVSSRVDEPVFLGNGVVVVDSIIGPGTSVTNAAMVERCVLGSHVSIDHGARLIHCIVGDNSTISCCELRNNLLFPGHAQHHNNSFLIASLVQGQSNIAAGATIGSNHNSRAADGELHAGRGFWPGLCVSLKHNSRFASFCLLVKGSYPAELNIPFPFSLVRNDPSENRLIVAPAYWWLHNMYALIRTTSKAAHRDKRVLRAQHIVTDFLAPDTVEEIVNARMLLARWAAKTAARQSGENRESLSDPDLLQRGVQLLEDAADGTGETPAIEAEGIERSSRPVVILEAATAFRAYEDMLYCYSVTVLLDYMEKHGTQGWGAIGESFAGPRQSRWVNLGGQIITRDAVEGLLQRIKSGQLASWNDVHRSYDILWDTFPESRQRHAFDILCLLLQSSTPTPKQWRQAVARASGIQDFILSQVRRTRQKDYDDCFRRMMYADETQMRAIVGNSEDDPFIQEIREQTRAVQKRMEASIPR